MRLRLLSELDDSLRARSAASADDVQRLKEAVAICVGDVEIRLAKLSVPIIRGQFMNGDSAQIVEVVALDWSLLDQLLVAGSICVIDLQRLAPVITNDTDARNLHVYFRQGTSGTWIKHSILLARSHEAADSDSDELDEDEDEDEDEPVLSEDEVSRLALKVARSEAFSSMSTRAARTAFARDVLSDDPSLPGDELSLQYVGERAHHYYFNGIAPMTAKQLLQEGKSVAQIAREMQLSRPRVEKALATPTSPKLAALLREKD